MPSPTMCLVFCFSPFFCVLFILFLLFPSISIDDMGAISGGFSFGSFFYLACFQMGFYFVTTGWIFKIGLCVNSIKINEMAAEVPQQPTAHTLGDEPTAEEVTQALRSLGTSKQWDRMNSRWNSSNSGYIITRQSSGSSIRSSSGSCVKERYLKGGVTRSLRSCTKRRT